jgi:hypothetical protein
MGRQKVLNWMVKGITVIQCPLSFLQKYYTKNNRFVKRENVFVQSLSNLNLICSFQINSLATCNKELFSVNQDGTWLATFNVERHNVLLNSLVLPLFSVPLSLPLIRIFRVGGTRLLWRRSFLFQVASAYQTAQSSDFSFPEQDQIRS